ncbi:MAG: hypothetical protein JRJ10_15205 [Deltaproteobacteria bacterium]|nr:hypothetical protein [Deltaproteobacteria bacterium]
MRLITLSIILTLLLIGCGDAGTPGSGAAGSGGDAGTGGSGGTGEFTTMLSHTYDPIEVDVGEELTNICQSWVLDNDEPIYVRKVRQTNEGGWHHSNWFFVPEAAYPPDYDVEGPDATLEGTWKCRDRSFREYLAAAMEVETVPADDVAVRLTPYSFAISNLRIPPAVDGVPTESRTAMLCDLRAPFLEHLQEDVVDYNVYYVLGHYHQWGNFFNLSFVQEDGTRETIFEIKNRIGEPIGSIIDPPMNNNGAPMLRSECGFINNTDETLTRGLQYGEMCDFLAYTDANLKIGASGGSNDGIPDDMVDGIEVHELDCGPITGFKAYAD